MTSYDSSRDSITTINGQIISVQRAKHLVNELESAIDTAEAYRARSELHEVGLNEMALQHLLDPSDTEYVLHVSLSYDTDTGEPPVDRFIEVQKDNSEYGLFEGLVNAPDIKTVFDETTGLTGMTVEIPGRN